MSMLKSTWRAIPFTKQMLDDAALGPNLTYEIERGLRDRMISDMDRRLLLGEEGEGMMAGLSDDQIKNLTNVLREAAAGSVIGPNPDVRIEWVEQVDLFSDPPRFKVAAKIDGKWDGSFIVNRYARLDQWAVVSSDYKVTFGRRPGEYGASWTEATEWSAYASSGEDIQEGDEMATKRLYTVWAIDRREPSQIHGRLEVIATSERHAKDRALVIWAGEKSIDESTMEYIELIVETRGDGEAWTELPAAGELV